jgi:S-adenosylmethionine hydrolase
VSVIVTLLTDFGTADGYVAEVKGVLLSTAPLVQVVDVSHDLVPGDVDAARLALARYWRRFPERTVHFVVVDPGVGTRRAALAVAAAGRFMVGPDNGVLSPPLLVPGSRAVALPVSADAAPTFHGRDVFAPAAAALALGRPLDSLGLAHPDPLLRRTPEPVREADGTIRGEVITVDRFGNAVTNLLGVRGGVIVVAGRQVPVCRTYSDVEAGAPVALNGSSGLLEVAVRDGSAGALLGLTRGAVVRWRPGLE